MFDKMTYIEFKDWCNQRVCDGQWSLVEAMDCISIMKEIDSIHIKGFFKKKANEDAKELAWQKIKS